jgi:hypothetical protein
MNIDFAALGFTKEDLQNRVVDQICDRLLTSGDEEGHSWINESKLQKDLDELIRQRIDERVTALANEHVLPNVQAIIENWTLQETSQWGEEMTDQMKKRIDRMTRDEMAEYWRTAPIGDPLLRQRYFWARFELLGGMADSALRPLGWGKP